jgi:hypothetical protein
MEQLADALRSAAGSPCLRGAALARFLHRSAKEVRAAARGELEGMRRELEQAALVSQHRTLVDEQVDGALASVAARLTAVVLECFKGVLDDPAPGVSPSEAMREAFAHRAEEFEQAFVADADALVEELRRLVEDLPELAVDARERPWASAGARRKQDGPRFNAEGAALSLRALIQRVVELRLGAPVADVERKVRGLEGMKGEALADALKQAGFESAEKKESAKVLIKRFGQASKVLEATPDAVQLYELLSDYRRGKLDQSQAQRAAERQEELVDDLVRQLLDDDTDGYRIRLERLRGAALEALGAGADAESSLREGVRDLEARLAALDHAVARLRG